MNILEEIIEKRRADVEAAKSKVSLDTLKELAGKRTHHSLKEKLQQNKSPRIIAETKKASPSAGLLSEDYRPDEIARGYQNAGAVGISVLTEPNYFMGSEEHLKAVRGAVTLPVLRKDFMFDPYQVYEAAAWGADVILLIIAAIKEDTLRCLYTEAIKCGLDVLAEVHSEEELEAAVALDEAIIGVNNRNLKTLQTELVVSHGLAEKIPETRVSVAESGIKSRFDLEELERAGYNGFLIGEALMKGCQPELKLNTFFA